MLDTGLWLRQSGALSPTLGLSCPFPNGKGSRSLAGRHLVGDERSEAGRHLMADHPDGWLSLLSYLTTELEMLSSTAGKNQTIVLYCHGLLMKF